MEQFLANRTNGRTVGKRLHYWYSVASVVVCRRRLSSAT